ncbi:MAG: DUF2190 family protein [Nanoarchaeota archaeon]|nr:DUF2190 family protein [Nanoarchaeota archaeon]
MAQVEERAGYHNVISLRSDAVADMPAGSPVKLTEDKTIGLAAAADQHIGVLLKAVTGGDADLVAVALVGPVITVIAGETVAYGNTVSAKETTGDGWFYTGETSANPIGIALESCAHSGIYFDMILLGSY